MAAPQVGVSLILCRLLRSRIGEIERRLAAV